MYKKRNYLFVERSIFTGNIRISQRHGLPGSSTVDRKLDLLVGELRRYGVSVAGMQKRQNGLVLMYGQLLMVTLCYILEGQYHRMVLL